MHSLFSGSSPSRRARVVLLATAIAALVAGAVVLPSAGASGADGTVSAEPVATPTTPTSSSAPGAPGLNGTDPVPSDTTTVPSDPVTPSKPAVPVRSYIRAAVPSDDDAPVGPLRLMIAGDSISHEFAGDYTWRWRLWNEFKRQNTAVQFVGPRTGVIGAIPLPPVPWVGDHHSALGGTRLSYEVPNFQSQVQHHQPDVMLLMTGFNDLNHGSRMPTVVHNMETFLNNVWAGKPDTRVVLHRILDTVVYPPPSPGQSTSRARTRDTSPW